MNGSGTLAACALVSFIWGSTNVFLKHSTRHITNTQCSNWRERLTCELRNIWINSSWLFFFGINQLGSILFYFVLLHSELSLVVPVTNSLTFLFTALTSISFGESAASFRTYCGSIFVLIGITFCVLDKFETS